MVPARNPPSNNSILRRSPYSCRILSITGENPQHQEHIGSATYQRIFSFMRVTPEIASTDRVQESNVLVAL